MNCHLRMQGRLVHLWSLPRFYLYEPSKQPFSVVCCLRKDLIKGRRQLYHRMNLEKLDNNWEKLERGGHFKDNEKHPTKCDTFGQTCQIPSQRSSWRGKLIINDILRGMKNKKMVRFMLWSKLILPHPVLPVLVRLEGIRAIWIF